MELLFLLLMLAPAPVAFRYTGYAVNKFRLQHHQTYSSICNFCKCDECGRKRHGHWEFESLWRMGDKACTNSDRQADRWHGMHPIPFIGGALLALLWPITLVLFGLAAGVKATGVLELRHSYFAPPPEILTKEERREKRQAASDARVAELEKRNAELESELGIGKQ